MKLLRVVVVIVNFFPKTILTALLLSLQLRYYCQSLANMISYGLQWPVVIRFNFLGMRMVTSTAQLTAIQPTFQWTICSAIVSAQLAAI